MTINPLTEDKYAEYEALISECGSIFNDLSWLRIFDKKVKVFTLNNSDGEIIGGFYLYIDRIMGIKYIKCPPFTPTNGLFFKSKTTNRAKKTSDLKKIMSMIADFYTKNSFGIIRIPFPSDYIDFQPFIWKKYKVVPNYTYVLNLDKSVEKLLSDFSPEKRNEIKRVEKDNILVTQEWDYNVINDLIKDTFKRNGINYNQQVLVRILTEFSKADNSFAFIAKNEQGTLAFSYCIHDKHTAFYLFGGNSRGNKHIGAGSATLWECMKKAKMIGLQKFDFEGSMNKHIEQYFRDFGGQLTPYYTINKANIFLELALTFYKREYF